MLVYTGILLIYNVKHLNSAIALTISVCLGFEYQLYLVLLV